MGCKWLGLQFTIEASNGSSYCYKFTPEHVGLEKNVTLRLLCAKGHCLSRRTYMRVPTPAENKQQL